MRTEDSLEQSLRRILKAAGYMMRKSHAPISPDNLGGYMIVDMSGNTVAAGGRFELTLEEVREWAPGYVLSTAAAGGPFLPQPPCPEHSSLW